MISNRTSILTGLEKDLPPRATRGTIYGATDTGNLYLYNYNSTAVQIGGNETSVYKGILEGAVPPEDLNLLWLDDRKNELFEYSVPDSAWLAVGAEESYVYHNQHVVTAGQKFEIALGIYEISVPEEMFPWQVSVSNDVSAIGDIELISSIDGIVGEYELTGAPLTSSGRWVNPKVISPGALLSVRLKTGSSSLQDSWIRVTLKKHAQ